MYYLHTVIGNKDDKMICHEDLSVFESALTFNEPTFFRLEFHFNFYFYFVSSVLIPAAVSFTFRFQFRLTKISLSITSRGVDQ